MAQPEGFPLGDVGEIGIIIIVNHFGRRETRDFAQTISSNLSFSVLETFL
jgi:hypothetical protein